MRRLATLVASISFVLTTFLWPCFGQTPENQASGTTVRNGIRIALSNDGMNFRETKKVLVSDAAAPSIVRLKDGRLLAYFDKSVLSARPGTVITGVSESADNGITWSAWQPVKFKGSIDRLQGLTRGQTLLNEKDEIELVMSARVSPEANAAAGKYKDDQLLLVMRSRDGREFRVSSHTRIKIEFNKRMAGPVYGFIGDDRHVFFDSPATVADESARPVAGHYMARREGKFVRAAAPRAEQINFDGAMLAVDAGSRLYFSRGGKVLSATSKNGRDWKLDSGVRFPSGTSPAVTRMRDGTYLMLYVSPVDDGKRGEDLSAESPMNSLARQANDAQFDALRQRITDDGAEASQPVPTEVGVVMALGAMGELGDTVNAGWEDSPEERYGFTSQEVVEPTDDYGFAPKPDFVNKIDYYDWYRKQMLAETTDNSYEYYSQFIQQANDAPGAKPEFPQASGMFSDADYEGPPGPWDPATHPEWAASDEAYRDLMSKFRDATRHSGYASPAEPSSRGEDYPDALLMEMLLPNLGGHRSLAKVTMENAWRADGGEVSQERMRDAMETILRGANHMSQGGTLIEHLVGIAERGLVHRNAMWSLKNEVFDEQGLQSTLDTLRSFDRGGHDPARFLRGEHAFGMDISQYLFEPPSPGEPPAIDLDRVNYVGGFIDGGADRKAQFANMTADDGRATVEAFDSYYRTLTDQMRVGYPNVRGADLDATTEDFLHTSPLTETLVPSLSRAYKLQARNEASRRATQLAYATHLFKAKNGHWPTSLNDLPAEYANDVRTDPFTGGDFGYRVDANGPQIYSMSEDGIDGGGVHSDRWDDEITNDAGSDDYVFYPPQMPKRSK